VDRNINDDSETHTERQIITGKTANILWFRM